MVITILLAVIEYSCYPGHNTEHMSLVLLVPLPGAAPAASAVAPEQPKGAQQHSATVRRWLKVSKAVGAGKARVWNVHRTPPSISMYRGSSTYLCAYARTTCTYAYIPTFVIAYVVVDAHGRMHACRSEIPLDIFVG